MSTTLNNNETCNSPAEWQWFDDCYSQSDSFFWATTIRIQIHLKHTTRIQTIYLFLKHQPHTSNKTAYLVNTKHPDMFIDLILAKKHMRETATKSHYYHPMPALRLKNHAIRCHSFFYNYGLSILSNLCSNVFSATCPESKKHIKKVMLTRLPNCLAKNRVQLC